MFQGVFGQTLFQGFAVTRIFLYWLRNVVDNFLLLEL